MKVLGKVEKKDLKKFLVNINLEDKNLYKEVGENQFGVFQFSGNTASRMIKEADIDNFNDLISVNALSRPGSSFSFPDFCANGSSGKSKYPEVISKYLKDSRGCILYQEEIMQLVEDLSNHKVSGNFCRGLLKRLGKANKKQEDLDAWDDLVKTIKEEAPTKGLTENQVDEFTNDLLILSSYSFNKSHAAAYSYLAAETIYLSKYFKAPFYSANLSFQAGTKDALKVAIKNAKKAGYKILPPNINTSQAHFSPSEGGLEFGLQEIKGVGEKPVEAIIKNRPYNSIDDFIIKNIGEKAINKRVVTALVGGGAFDSLFPEDERRKYFNITTEFYEKKKTKKIPDILKQLWNDIEEEHSIDIKTDIEDYINFENKYLDGNFFNGMFSQKMIDKIDKLYSLHKCLRNFEDVREEGRSAALVPVQVKSYHYHTQKNGQEMCFLTIEDCNGEEVSVPVFASYWNIVKVKFFAEGYYFLSLFEKEGQIMFGSRNWVGDKTKSYMMLKWNIDK